MLTDAQHLQYERDGYLVLPDFRAPAEVAAVRARAEAIVQAFEPDAATGVFSTRNPAVTADAALIASADAVHCFFEEEAFDAEGRLAVPKARAINKIGHALHDRDPVFDRFSRGADLAALAGDLGLAEPQVWQSMLIFKQPAIGGEVRWHQDATFFVTEPVSVTTFWFALEDAALDNGCLWVQPGGLRARRRRAAAGGAGRQALAGRARRRAAAVRGRHAGGLPRPAAALQRAQPQRTPAHGLHAARDRCAHAIRRHQLAAARGRARLRLAA
jgi:phytanoyl-CoA hydroxylase